MSGGTAQQPKKPKPPYAGEATLLPCPFCGGKGRLEQDEAPNMTCCYVICISCACEGPWGKHATTAMGLWNRRVTPESEAPHA